MSYWMEASASGMRAAKVMEWGSGKRAGGPVVRDLSGDVCGQSVHYGGVWKMERRFEHD
jgi:hypothetical protein